MNVNVPDRDRIPRGGTRLRAGGSRMLESLGLGRRDGRKSIDASDSVWDSVRKSVEDTVGTSVADAVAGRIGSR